MKFLKDIDFKNKRVLVRADFNTPLENGEILDDYRIRITIPTIEHIINQPKSKVVIISHLGRPEGKVTPEFSLRPIAKKLGELMKKEIIFIEDILSDEGDKQVRNLKDGQIALAENIRFYPEEERGDEDFAVKICHHFGFFVNEAFSVSHRPHASVSVIPKFKPSCAGLDFEKEIKELSQALKPHKRPAIAIIGGAKIETKMPIIENLASTYDAVLVGGKIAVEAKEQNLKFKKNVVLPEDYIDEALDIGPLTCEKYKKVLAAASFLVWNGAMGKFEDPRYEKGTREILDAICASDAHKIAGGGETVEYINNQEKADCFNFISSGGGSMLEFLSGEILPGIKALEDSH
jgi:phosphoglycerate kinase